MDELSVIPQAPISKAEEIKNRFKNLGKPAEIVTSENKNEKAIEAISDRAKEKEKFYAEVGEQRATTTREKVKKEKAEIADKKVKQTTIRLYTHMQKAIYVIEGNLIGEDVKMNYEDIMMAGLEKLQAMSPTELVAYIKSIKKSK